MQVVVLQLDAVWEQPAVNRERARRLADGAGVPPGSLVVLPELFATGFSMNTPRTAEPPRGATERFLCGLARDTRSHVVGGLAVRGADGLHRNVALAADPGGKVVCRYAKRRLFAPGGEPGAYTAGQAAGTFALGTRTASLALCYELRFADLFLGPAAAGAAVFVVPANWPAERAEHWRVLVRARAIETQAFVVGANRCGRDPHHRYAGGSLVADPRGAVLAEAGAEETSLRADIDFDAVDTWRAQFPFLSDAARALP